MIETPSFSHNAQNQKISQSGKPFKYKIIFSVILMGVALVLFSGFTYFFYTFKNQAKETPQVMQNNQEGKIMNTESVYDILSKIEKNAPIKYKSVSYLEGSDTPLISITAEEDPMQKLTQWSFIELSRKIKDNPTLRVIGVEQVDDKIATIIEFSGKDNGASFFSKSWIWNDKGVILRSKTTDYAFNNIPVRTTDTFYSDFVFAEIVN